MMLAFLLCTCEPGEEKEVTRELQKNEEITETFVVYGKYDVIGKIEVQDLTHLNELVSDIRQSNHITNTHILVTMEW